MEDSTPAKAKGTAESSRGQETQTPANRRGEPSTSAPQQRQGTSGPSGNARKFVPNVPQRRKKAGDGSGSAADAAAGEDAFKDLIRAAQAEGKWERGGRGRGRGRGQGTAQVTFGGSGHGRGFASSTSMPSRGSGGATGGSKWSGVKAENGANGSRGLTTAAKSDRIAHLEAQDLLEDEDLDEKPRRGTPRAEMLDYHQYYPTSLPLKDPASLDPHDDDEDDEASGLPVDLLTFQEEEDSDVASALGLLQTEEDPGTQILFQLPSVLPTPGQQIKAEQPERRRRGARTEDAASSHPGTSLKELRPGKMGKLLVFANGAVKLQLGQVVLEVSLGSECKCCQDVAALNPTAGHCVFLGDISARAICSPNIDQLLSGEPVPQWPRAHSAAVPPVSSKSAMPVVKSEPSDLVDAMDIDGSKAEEKR